MSVEKITAKVLYQEEIANDIYSMVIEASNVAKLARPGQFVNVYSNDGSRLLPRPISICEIDKNAGTIRIVYRIAGKGTKEFSSLKAQDDVEIMGPLGNGFPIENKKAIIIGGGIGIPPMLELAKSLECEKNIVLGYRDELFMNNQFEKYGKVYIASEDGKNGVKGNVLDAIREYGIDGEIIYACGPTPMLKAIKEYAESNNIVAKISLEERMACGVGACLACVCKSKEKDEHTNVNNKRVCKDGPVFDSREVTL